VANFGPKEAVSVAAVVILLITLVLRSRTKALPGKLTAKGSFEHEDPGSADALGERGRDFARLAATKRDVWIVTDGNRKPATILPLEIPTGGDFDAEATVKPCLQKLRFWMQGELGKIPGAIDLGMTSRWPVLDRVVAAISVSPGFDFVMRHKVPPMLLQVKYILMISRSGQVRVAWYAFVTDKPAPGATAGPFVVKMVSEDLNAERERSYTTFDFTAKATREVDMEKVISGQMQQILRGIDQDDWAPFLKA